MVADRVSNEMTLEQNSDAPMTFVGYRIVIIGMCTREADK